MRSAESDDREMLCEPGDRRVPLRRSEKERQQNQGGNLGQKDARQEKKKESDLSRMGEMSREKKEGQQKRR